MNENLSYAHPPVSRFTTNISTGAFPTRSALSIHVDKPSVIDKATTFEQTKVCIINHSDQIMKKLWNKDSEDIVNHPGKTHPSLVTKLYKAPTCYILVICLVPGRCSVCAKSLPSESVIWLQKVAHSSNLNAIVPCFTYTQRAHHSPRKNLKGRYRQLPADYLVFHAQCC